MKKLILIIGITLVSGTAAMADTKLGENYNMGCGEVTTINPYIGFHGTYWVELSISNSYTSGVVTDTGLIKEIQNAKLNKEKICLGLEYNSEVETSFISYLMKTNP
jgi:hypothetical protein